MGTGQNHETLTSVLIALGIWSCAGTQNVVVDARTGDQASARVYCELEWPSPTLPRIAARVYSPCESGQQSSLTVKDSHGRELSMIHVADTVPRCLPDDPRQMRTCDPSFQDF